MQILIDLDLPGLEQAIASLLPKGVSLLGLETRGQELRASLVAPMVGKCTLTAALQTRMNALSLSRFNLEGAGLAKPFALAAIRRKLAEVDQIRGPLHIWGESEGEKLQLSWGAA
jgi:hypothetical protein